MEQLDEAGPKKRQRSGGAAGRRQARLRAPLVYPKTTVRKIPTYEVLSTDGLEAIDDHALRILETIGCEFRDDVAATMWKEAGADVVGHRVRPPRELIRKLMATVPAEFDYHGRNPDRTVRVGGRNMIFGPPYGTPHLIDLDGVRRTATKADMAMLMRLHQVNPALHYNGGYTLEPMDVAVPHRHLGT